MYNYDVNQVFFMVFDHGHATIIKILNAKVGDFINLQFSLMSVHGNFGLFWARLYAIFDILGIKKSSMFFFPVKIMFYSIYSKIMTIVQ